MNYYELLKQNPNLTNAERAKLAAEVAQFNLRQQGSAVAKPLVDQSHYQYMSDDNQYINMRTTDGGYATVHKDYAGVYQALGYNSNLDAPLDYNKLPSNSVYRPENAQGVNGQYVQPLNFYNVPNQQGVMPLGSLPQQQAPQNTFGQAPQYNFNNNGGGFTFNPIQSQNLFGKPKTTGFQITQQQGGNVGGTLRSTSGSMGNGNAQLDAINRYNGKDIWANRA